MEMRNTEARDQRDDQDAGRKMALSSIVITVILFTGKIAGYGKEMLMSRWMPKEATDAIKVVYNNIFGGLFNLVPRSCVRSLGWHLIAKAVK